jgi:hypothetical protein
VADEEEPDKWRYLLRADSPDGSDGSKQPAGVAVGARAASVAAGKVWIRRGEWKCNNRIGQVSSVCGKSAGHERDNDGGQRSAHAMERDSEETQDGAGNAKKPSTPTPEGMRVKGGMEK